MTVGLARGLFGVLVAVVAVLLQVLFCITLARLATTSMAGLLRSRRGKDLAAFLIIPIFALYEFFTQVVPKEAADGTFTTASFRGIDSWLRWPPPGLAAHAIGDASDGHPGPALLRLALLAAVIVVLGWLWIRSLSRALVHRGYHHPVIAGARRGPAAGPVRPARRGGRPVLDHQRREPRIAGLLGDDRGHHGRRIGPGHPRPAWSSRLRPGQCRPRRRVRRLLPRQHRRADRAPVRPRSLGADRPPRAAAYFSGQNIVLGVIAVPLLTAVCFGLAAVAGRPGFGFLGTAVGLAGLGGALALSNILTVVMAYPMDKRPGNPLRQPAAGYTSYQFFAVLGRVGGTALLASPVIIATVLTSADPASVRMPALLLFATAYGLALAIAGPRIAAAAAEGRLPELCQVAIRSKL